MAKKMMNFYKVLIFLCSFLISNAFAQQNKVLIVNTNANVPRYAKIASEFKLSLQKNTYQWQEFNLEKQSDPAIKLQQLIADENPSIIYCIGSKAYSLAQHYAGDKPLLFSAAINWHRLNINDTTYGISNELSPEQEVSSLKMFFPTIKKMGIFYSRYNQEYIETVKKAAADLNVELFEKEISDTTEINNALNELLPKIDLLWVISDPGILETDAIVMQIFQAAKQQQKLVYAYSDTYLPLGAVLAASSDPGTIGRQSAILAISLLQSRIPATQVQFPAGSSFSLNMCTVEALNIKLNKEALTLVNKIVYCNNQ